MEDLEVTMRDYRQRRKRGAAEAAGWGAIFKHIGLAQLVVFFSQGYIQKAVGWGKGKQNNNLRNGARHNGEFLVQCPSTRSQLEPPQSCCSSMAK